MKLCTPVTLKKKNPKTKKKPKDVYELDLKLEYNAMIPLFILLGKKVTSL